MRGHMWLNKVASVLGPLEGEGDKLYPTPHFLLEGIFSSSVGDSILSLSLFKFKFWL